MFSKKKLTICFSLDVEEEGLFSGAYATQKVPLKNIAFLKLLIPLCKEFKIPLTLFCAWPVFKDFNALHTIEILKKHCTIEIGAHLHYWSTPPFKETSIKTPNTNEIPLTLLEDKLCTLLEAGKKETGDPITSFRMGRWDLRRKILPILARNGIKVDSSICPLRKFKNGPDHFMAPSQPYWVYFSDLPPILEAPITQIPIFSPFAFLWHKVFKNNSKFIDYFHFFAALSSNPIWHKLPIMKLAAIKCTKDTGILCFFLHSSELMPGASPNVPNQKAVSLLLKKLHSFLSWLHNSFNLTAVTTSEIRLLPEAKNFSIVAQPEAGDW